MSRKPMMDGDKRKVLDLLEFCAEMSPNQRICQIIGNAIPADVFIDNNNDTFYVTDWELAGWLQDYADNLLQQRGGNEH